MSRPTCPKCGGKLVIESYPAEDMLARKCFMCGRIAGYRQLSREESRRLFRPIDPQRTPMQRAS